jgi:hypothetical protein
VDCWDWLERALRGVDLLIVSLLPSTVIGAVISAGVIASAQGLLDGSSNGTALPCLLSLLLSRMLFGSPRMARDLINPAELPVELNSDVVLLAGGVDVSMRRPGFGDLVLS